MDVFTNAARSKQIHDVNPGNGGMPGRPSGLFWTFAAPTALGGLGTNKARIEVSAVSQLDFFQTYGASPALATLTMTVEWSGDLGAVHLNETSEGSRFIFDGVKSDITASWQITTQISQKDSRPFAFETTGAATRTYAVLGHERNGTFA